MFNENLNVFVNTSELALDVVLTQGVASRTIKVLFDKDYQSFSFGGEGRNIRAKAKTSDLANIKHGDTLLLDSVTYTVSSFEPVDDGAFTDLILRE